MASQRELLAKVKELSQYAWYCDRPDCDGKPHGVFLNPHARKEQRPPEGDWWGWFLRAGRGFGKTRSGCEFVKSRMLDIPGHRVAIIAPDFGVARDVVIEGRSGLHGPVAGQGVIPARYIKNWNRSIGELSLTNGSIAKIFGTDKRKDAEKLRGFEFGTAHFEELGTCVYGDVAWDMLEFGLRDKRSSPKVVITSTPRPTPLIKKLCTDDDIVLRTGRTYDNIENLNAKFVERIKKKYEGTTLGRQELDGEILDGAEGALFNYDIIGRVGELPDGVSLVRVVVGVDPAGSTKKTSDETGIVVAGLGSDGKFYVLADKTGRHSPEEWRRIVEQCYDEFEADAVVAEKNFGGDLVAANLRAGGKRLKAKMVTASRGKALRAEPVVTLYERGLGVHVGLHAELEDEMTEWVPPGRFDKDGEPIPESTWSPNRLDAVVWCAVDLLLKPKKTRRAMRFPIG